jgi:predicted ATPase
MKERFRLQKVAIENFKAVTRSGELSLTPLTVFIGNNGAGKSSLIEGLETYCNLVLDGADSAFARWFGVEQVWNKQSSHRQRTGRKVGQTYENPIVFHLKGVWARGSFSARVDICPEIGTRAPRIENEFLMLPGGRIYRRDREGRSESFNDAHLERVRRVQLDESAAPQDWSNLLRRWQFLRLNPAALGMPKRPTRKTSMPVLERDGANIGQYVESLRTASVEAFNGAVEALQCVLPYASDLQPVEVADAIEKLVYLEMTEGGFKIPSWLLSTGTLRVVALLACLRHPAPPPLLIVEELENGLDPRTLNLVVEEIRTAITSGTTQVICTTHSPYLLDLLDLSHIVMVDCEDGETVFHRPDGKELAEWAKSFSPGLLYTMGRFKRKQP